MELDLKGVHLGVAVSILGTRAETLKREFQEGSNYWSTLGDLCHSEIPLLSELKPEVLKVLAYAPLNAGDPRNWDVPKFHDNVIKNLTTIRNTSISRDIDLIEGIMGVLKIPSVNARIQESFDTHAKGHSCWSW